MREAVYLDYSATTPVDPRVARKMSACLLADGNFGNPASHSHVFGWRAEEAVEEARVWLAKLLNCDPREIIWTSGATESDNLAIKGIAEYYGATRRHLITSQIEHKAVLDTCQYLESRGFEVTYIAPTAAGIIEPEAIQRALRANTLLVSVIHANNEIGTVNDIATIGRICREAGVFLHTDGAQSVGKLAIDLKRLPVDLLSISGHKLYGPKGIGVLYVRRDPPVYLAPQIHGGGHERGMRSGTLATHQIVGLGEAARIALEEQEQESKRLLALRNRLWSHLKQLEGASLNGDEQQRLPANLNVAFAGVDGETLLMALDDVAVSSGSACTSASVEPSYVLKAIGLSDELAQSSLRFTVGRFTTREEVDYAARRVVQTVEKLRARNAA